MDDSVSLTSEEQQQQQRHGVLKSMLTIDLSYITNSWLGRVKLLQLICVTMAGCILPSAIGVFFTRFSFYTFVVWTSFMYITVDLVLHVTSLWQRLPRLCRMSDIWIYPVLIGALAFLISSSLVLSVADMFHGSRGTRCGVSGAFGLITMMLFLVEAFLHYRNQNVNNNTDEEQPSLGGTMISMPVSRNTDQPPAYSSTPRHAEPTGSY